MSRPLQHVAFAVLCAMGCSTLAVAELAAESPPAPFGSGFAGALTPIECATAMRAHALQRGREVCWPRSLVPNEGSQQVASDPPASRVLASMLASSDPASRVLALERLCHAAHPADLPHAVHALYDPEAAVRDVACRGLSAFEPEAVFEAVMDLSCRDWPASGAALSLAATGHRAVFEDSLAQILGSSQESSLRRTVSAYGLGCLGSPSSTALLAELAWCDDLMLAEESAVALAAARLPATVPDLARLCRHPSRRARLAALEGLAQCGTTAAIDALAQVATSTSDDTRELQYGAVVLLESVPHGHAIGALIEAMRRNLFVRRKALEALKRRTGLDLGEAPSDWAAWFDDKDPPLMPAMPPPPPIEDARIPARIELDLFDDDENVQHVEVR